MVIQDLKVMKNSKARLDIDLVTDPARQDLE